MRLRRRDPNTARCALPCDGVVAGYGYLPGAPDRRASRLEALSGGFIYTSDNSYTHCSRRDHQGLEDRVCECYSTVAKEYSRLLPDPLPASARCKAPW